VEAREDLTAGLEVPDAEEDEDEDEDQDAEKNVDQANAQENPAATSLPMDRGAQAPAGRSGSPAPDEQGGRVERGPGSAVPRVAVTGVVSPGRDHGRRHALDVGGSSLPDAGGDVPPLQGGDAVHLVRRAARV
jgi:hypothetical protein